MGGKGSVDACRIQNDAALQKTRKNRLNILNPLFQSK